MSKKHPGFQAVEEKIEGEGYSKDAAGAILAKKSREASEEAREKNPRLNRVKGPRIRIGKQRKKQG